MEPEKEQELTRLLTNKLNPWWITSQAAAPAFQRSDFEYLFEKIKTSRAITLIGPRQVGKTTISKQIIRRLLEQGIPANRIIYADFSDKEIRLQCAHPLYDVISLYRRNILQEDFEQLKSDAYLFLDEVQKDDEWAETVKSYIDHYEKLHILSTGSSSLNVSQKNKETLPGRSLLQVMLPLKFADFLRIRSFKGMFRHDADALRNSGKEMRSWFLQALQKRDFSRFEQLCLERRSLLSRQETDIEAEFGNYLSRGGYPQIAISDDVSQCNSLLNSYATDVIVKDLAGASRGIRDYDLAEKTLYLLAKISGEELNVNELLKHLQGRQYITVRKYIDLFDEACLINEIPIYSGTKLGSTKHPKIYFQDVGMRNALCGLLDAPFSETDKGHLAETIACDHINRLSFKLNLNIRGNVYCWKSSKGEVDFVVRLPRFRLELPIESKYRRNPESAPMREFLESRKQPLGLILTRDVLKLDRGVLFMPMWAFALMC